MGGAIARGYALSLAAGADDDGAVLPKECVLVFDPDTSKSEALAGVPGVVAMPCEAELLARSEIVIFAIKPQMFDEVVPRIANLWPDRTGRAAEAPGVTTDKVFVSIAAGVSIDWLLKTLGSDAKVIRVMPNTPAMVGEGMSAIARSASVTDAELGEVMEVFGAVGRVLEVQEGLLDAVTGISGSSPAYAYMYMQALIESGVRHGLGEKEARIMAAQSTLGAAKMVLDNEDISVEQMRMNVCSPGGTTIEAVHTLEKEGFMDSVKRAVYACVKKSKRMGI
jgi:pyrroline-5-carboxylate reductase